jgi:hypothetical protein
LIRNEIVHQCSGVERVEERRLRAIRENLAVDRTRPGSGGPEEGRVGQCRLREAERVDTLDVDAAGQAATTRSKNTVFSALAACVAAAGSSPEAGFAPRGSGRHRGSRKKEIANTQRRQDG